MQFYVLSISQVENTYIYFKIYSFAHDLWIGLKHSYHFYNGHFPYSLDTVIEYFDMDSTKIEWVEGRHILSTLLQCLTHVASDSSFHRKGNKIVGFYSYSIAEVLSRVI